jgi:hypothetical protein
LWLGLVLCEAARNDIHGVQILLNGLKHCVNAFLLRAQVL